MITDELIQSRLPRNEARELLTLTREIGIPSVDIVVRFEKMTIDEYFESQKEQLKQLKEWKAGTFGIKRLEKTLRCWELYKKVSDDHKECLRHWNKSFSDQKNIRNSYKKMSKPPRQDNKTYINYGNRSGYLRDIRFPKKNRKTAWKRFYKLFPHLNPENEKET